MVELATRGLRASSGVVQSTRDSESVLKEAICKNNSDDLALTIKNYSQQKGLSTWIHQDASDQSTLYQIYQVKGPMG